MESNKAETAILLTAVWSWTSIMAVVFHLAYLSFQSVA
jgi:hypothetical protein